MPDGSQRAKGVASTFQHTVLYWLMTSLAAALFIPCAVLGVYADYASWRSYRAEVEAHVTALQARVRRNETVIDGLRTDPAVNARLLAHDLGCTKPGVEVVSAIEPLTSNGSSSHTPSACVGSGVPVPSCRPSGRAGYPIDVELQPWEAQVERRLTRAPWLAIFVDPPSRNVLLVMSGALILSALLLYPSSSRTRPRGPVTASAAGAQRTAER